MNIINLIITLLFINFIDCVKVGMEIPPNLNYDNDLLTDINLINHELYSMDFEKDQKNVEKLNLKLNKILESYLINNSCLRYYLNDYVKFSDIDKFNKNLNNDNNDNNNDKKIDSNEGFMIAFNFEFSSNGEIDSRIQKLNLSLLDKNVNILRRINNINQENLKLLINYPLNNKDEEFFNNQYFDLCFENIKYDKSWNSKPIPINAFIEINFGINEISEKYHQSTLLIYDASNELNKIDNELDIIVNQLLKNLETSEPELRNKNEDTLTKYMIYFILTFVIYLIVNFGQIFWLIKYLKKRDFV